MSDIKVVNSVEFVDAITPVGAGSRAISLPPHFVKRRFDFDHGLFPLGSATLKEDKISVSWSAVGWPERDDARHFGQLYFVAPINGVYFTWPVEKLRRPVENLGTESLNTEGWDVDDIWGVIFDGKSESPVIGQSYRPPEGALCAVWVGPWPGTPDEDRRTDLYPIRFKSFGEVQEPKPIIDKGVSWGAIEYPQLCMAPVAARLTREDINWRIVEFVFETGFDGFHVPMQGEWNDAIEYLVQRASIDGFHVHLWLYGDRQSDTAPKNPNNEEARAFQAFVASRLKRFPNWSMGLGYDLHEWASETDDVGGFVHFMKVGLSLPQRIGGRYLPEERGPYPGGFISVEQRIDK